MNQTPASERVHIAFFGKRNAGKSSIINAITGQNIAIVSPIRGTTTDPVYKAMELLPLGPVMLIDTPGVDDEGELGTLRIKKTFQVLNKTDIAILIIDSTIGITSIDEQLISLFQKKEIPFLLVYNKADLKNHTTVCHGSDLIPTICVSAKNNLHIQEMKEKIASLMPSDTHKYPIVADLIQPMELVILVIPIDKAAPKGRLILPQQQTIRDILERGAISITVRDTELEETLTRFQKHDIKPRLVITDSQVFSHVSHHTPKDIMLTSFSILFARYKGSLETLVKGVTTLDTLKDGDTILISEGCTHHRQCNDIGSVKLPNWIQTYTGKHLKFVFTSGTEFPEELSSYKMIVHCGGCMLNEREMKYRISCAQDQSIPITNYGILIAQMNDILKRSLEPFPEILKLFT